MCVLCVCACVRACARATLLIPTLLYCNSFVAVSLPRIPASMRDFNYRADGHYPNVIYS